MKPINIRNDTWKDIQVHLEADRKAVWEGYCIHGPCTTRQLSEKIPISLFTIRPRTTELLEMFLVELTGRNKDGGIYSHVPFLTARERFNQAHINSLRDQLELFK